MLETRYAWKRGSKEEICLFDFADRAENFSNAQRLAQLMIEKGTTVDTLWKERFQRIVEYAKDIILVDRYCMANHLEHTVSGLRGFLERLGARPSARKVTIFAAFKHYQNPDRMARSLKDTIDSLPGTGVKEVDVFLVPFKIMKDCVHDRFLRLDKTVIELGIGIDVLAGVILSSPCSCNVNYMTEPHIKVEKELRNAVEGCRPQELFWRMEKGQPCPGLPQKP